jgi:hypothetical protein
MPPSFIALALPKRKNVTFLATITQEGETDEGTRKMFGRSVDVEPFNRRACC